MATEGVGAEQAMSNVLSDSEQAAPSYRGGNTGGSNDVNLVLSASAGGAAVGNINAPYGGRNGGYQTEEKVIVDSQERVYNGIRAKFGMRTRSINLGLASSIDENGYFVERLDTENYDTNMTPWVGYENDYLLGLHTAIFANLKNATCCGGGSSGVSLGIEWAHTVIHCKDSSRLIIKKRDQVGVFEQAKRTVLIILFVLMLLIGFICLGSGSGGAIAVGILFILGAFFVLYRALLSASGSGNSYSFTTQSIPINSIFWVDRKLTVVEENQCCQIECCCPEQTDIDKNFSTITIGFNRNVMSNSFNQTTFVAPSNKDTNLDQVTIKLENNQAYNLHQYLDGIMTGKNVLQYNHIDSKFIYYPVLPSN